MVNWKIPLYKIFTDDEDLNLITKVIQRGNNWALGPEIEEFENALKNYVGVDYCLTLNSGTSALHSALLANEIGLNDEVIVPSFSFISTANSVLFVGGKPIFADIEEKTFGLSISSITSKKTSKTKAIIPMDYGGSSCNIFEINQFAKDNNLILIEDAAESLGSTIQGKKVGSQSDCSIFSFCGNKVLTTGEGGAIITNSKKIYDKIKLIRSHGRMDLSKNYFENEDDSQYTSLGYNWRMSSLTAALGISQINKLDKLIKLRQSVALKLSNGLSKFKEISTFNPPSGYGNIYQMYTIRLPSHELRNKLHNFLTTKQIFSKVYFNPIHMTDFYKKKSSLIESLPVTELISNQILTIPLYPNMTSDEISYVLDAFDEFFENDLV
ncbi:Glutamine--scyllo-inositol transaminase [metagenome]